VAGCCRRGASPGVLPRRAWSAGCWSEERKGGGRYRPRGGHARGHARTGGSREEGGSRPGAARPREEEGREKKGRGEKERRKEK
jgi:hypothetical protein